MDGDGAGRGDGIVTACPECGARYRIGPEHSGKRTRCGKCGASFVISSSEEVQDPPPLRTVAEGERREEARRGEQDVPAAWEVGDVILGLYEVTGVLGEGGFGTVYRVHHREWEMDLAAKCPKPGKFETERQVENFTRECETWMDLGLHPNTVSCHYVRRLGGLPRVFVECVEGGSLEDWIQEGRLHEGEETEATARILDIAIQFARGLDYAHGRGLVHQDVKPQNVMMTPDGVPKVTDFGMAKARAAAGEEDAAGGAQSILVSSGGMTPAYCSPEQARHGKLGRGTDIWSWAVGVLEMFTRQVIWPTGSVVGDLLAEYLDMGADGPLQVPMPRGLEGLLGQCLREAPEDRPDDMRQVAAALEAVYEEVSGEPYAREEQEAAELLADGLNNRAISLLDLGRREEAESLFEEALRADPHHPEATYNRGLLLWRAGRLTDADLIRQLEEVRASQEEGRRADYMPGLVHLERGDARGALSELHSAAGTAATTRDVEEWEQLAREAADAGRDTTSLAVLEAGEEVPLVAVAFSPESSGVAAAAASGQVWVWPDRAAEPFTIVRGRGSRVTKMGFAVDGSRLLVGHESGMFTVVEVQSGEIVETGLDHAGFREQGLDAGGSSFGRDKAFLSGDTYAAVIEDGVARIVDRRSGRCVRTLEGEAGRAETVLTNAQPGLVLWGSSEGRVHIWRAGQVELLRAPFRLCRPKSARQIAETARRHASLRKSALKACKSGDAPRAYRLIEKAMSLPGFGRHATSFWMLRSLASKGQRTGIKDAWARQVTSDEMHGALSLAQAGRLAATWDRTGSLALWDLVRGDRAASIELRASGVAATDISPDQKQVAALDEMGWVLICSVKTGEVLRSWRCDQKGPAGCIRFGPGGTHLLTVYEHGALVLWDVASGAPATSVQTEGHRVRGLQFAPDGEHWASIGAEGSAVLWGPQAAGPLLEFPRQGVRGTCLTFSPGGGYLLCGYEDGMVVLWEIQGGRQRLQWRAADSPIRALAFAGGHGHIVAVDGAGRVIFGLLTEGDDGGPAVAEVCQRPVFGGSVARCCIGAQGWVAPALDGTGNVNVGELRWGLEFDARAENGETKSSPLPADVPWQGPAVSTTLWVNVRSFVRRYRKVAIAACVFVALAVLAWPAYRFGIQPVYRRYRDIATRDELRAFRNKLDTAVEQGGIDNPRVRGLIMEGLQAGRTEALRGWMEWDGQLHNDVMERTMANVHLRRPVGAAAAVVSVLRDYEVSAAEVKPLLEEALRGDRRRRIGTRADIVRFIAESGDTEAALGLLPPLLFRCYGMTGDTELEVAHQAVGPLSEAEPDRLLAVLQEYGGTGGAFPDLPWTPESGDEESCRRSWTQLLQTPNAPIRHLAAGALGRYGQKARAAAPMLEECLQDHSEKVRKAAAEALSSIRPSAEAGKPAEENPGSPREGAHAE